MNEESTKATAPITLAALDLMSLQRLQREYQRLFGAPVSASNSQLAKRKIAWRLQAQVHGALPEAARQRALAIARNLRVHRATAGSRAQGPGEGNERLQVSCHLKTDHDPRLPMAGSVLVKRYQNRVHVVHVQDAGFEYESKKFRSLSAVALEITGTRWNGFTFFELNQGRPNAIR